LDSRSGYRRAPKKEKIEISCFEELSGSVAKFLVPDWGI
jgi:hypothetical protein